MAGTQAILSFTAHSPLSIQSPANIPWLLALYDYLNDDDEEIREIAASATSPILGKPLVSIEASARLLSWLAQHYGSTDEFRTHVACRMIGHPAAPAQATDAILPSWVPAGVQLARAMRFDDSLFVVEEQNLYIDEVREALRWRDVFLSLPSHPNDGGSAALAALTDWTTVGLRTLQVHAEGDDGVLGWTSKPEVFAICSRVVICGVALAEKRGDVKRELRMFAEKGGEKRVHELLLGMCEGK
jgi:hypothetical protein